MKEASLPDRPSPLDDRLVPHDQIFASNLPGPVSYTDSEMAPINRYVSFGDLMPTFRYLFTLSLSYFVSSPTANAGSA